MLTDDPQAGGLTLDRAAEIERGEGSPATEAERKTLARVQAVVRPFFTPAAMRKVAAAKCIYKAASPIQKRRLWDMTFAEVVAEHRASARQAVPGRPRAAARAPRRRSVRTWGVGRPHAPPQATPQTQTNPHLNGPTI